MTETPAKATKGERTRAHLLDVAIRMFARNGIAATSVLEITQEAEVSNGTFYYHFRTKDALVHAVGQVLIEEFVEGLHATYDEHARPEQRVAIGVQWMVARATTDPELGWVVAEAIRSDGDFREQTSARFQRDVREGLESEVFTIEATDLFLDIFSAVTSLAIEASLRGSDPAPGWFAAQQHLRMLGVSPADARTLADEAASRLAG